MLGMRVTNQYVSSENYEMDSSVRSKGPSSIPLQEMHVPPFQNFFEPLDINIEEMYWFLLGIQLFIQIYFEAVINQYV